MPRTRGRGRLHIGDVCVQVVEELRAAVGPGAQRRNHLRHGARRQVTQGSDLCHLHALPGRVELGVEEAGVYRRRDEALELLGRGEPQRLLQAVICQVGAVAGERQQAELAQLERLGIVEGRQAAAAAAGQVGLVCAVGEDAEEVEVREEVGVGGEGLDLRRLQQLGEYIGALGGGGPFNEVGGGSWRGCRLGEG